MNVIKKVYLQVFLIFIVFSIKANAAITEDVALCEQCYSDAEFSLMAKSNGQGEIAVFNPINLVVKSFNVIPNQRAPGQTIAVPKANSAEVINALEEATDLRDAFIAYYGSNKILASDSSSFYGKTVGEMLMSSKSLPANGCGSPSSPWSYNIIPNMPFLSACDKHDLCYETNRTKSSCDREFYSDMQDIIIELQATVGLNIFTLAVLQTQAIIYYGAVAVTEDALDAYCASTSGPSQDCSQTSQNTAGGEKIDDTSFISGSGDKAYVLDCELWEFPNGNGGYYYLYRNCKPRSYP